MAREKSVGRKVTQMINHKVGGEGGKRLWRGHGEQEVMISIKIERGHKWQSRNSKARD